MARRLRVLVADDHPIVRSGLRQMLADAPDVEEVGEAADPQQVLDLARARDWDVIVLDISLPGRGGLDVLKTLKDERPKRPVLILSMHAENQYAVRTLRAGAAGYLTKEAAPERLLEAIRKVAAGGRYISPAVADQLAGVIGGDAAAPPHQSLSDREFEVLRLIASGKTVGEIAKLLSLSVKTVSSYRARILEKTGLKNNAGIMRYALEHRLVE
ncbi:MAG: DNA-binding response regulator [Acidobacteria bacterium RIFCSPLOWO2_02_FULL_68_18]|nr:MAG: DNA-binding response regulator [Acidobacteria bacterium RIFCSPLOWO2_02_FULL_68_18]OFW51272.1 MAG: DNA-binding response regulator [Acidobacteria bacterium RIFCSPLOWO2_12_FULL_68_19]